MLENQVVSLFRERKKEKSDSRIAHNTKCLQMFLGFAKKKGRNRRRKKIKKKLRALLGFLTAMIYRIFSVKCSPDSIHHPSKHPDTKNVDPGLKRPK